MFNPLVCSIPNDTKFAKSIVETTTAVCQRLCSSELEGEMCSGYLYDSLTRTCILTSYTGEDKEWFTVAEADDRKEDCLRMKKYFYRKQRCIGINFHAKKAKI